MERPFTTMGTIGRTPVVVSVPHAGRAYPVDIEAALAVPLAATVGLEDRHADALVDRLAADGHYVVVARTPRLLIDLNRAEDDLDPDMAEPGAAITSRARAGLGLVPTRLGNGPALWRVPPDSAVIEERLTRSYRPYHAALAQALAAARERWGHALLIDLHSMPSLVGPHAAQIVLGDRGGTTAAATVALAAQAAAQHAGFRTACNTPYAGGAIVTRHGRPEECVHALQVEVDRRCYLARALLQPTPARHRVAAMLADAARRMVDALDTPTALAAE